MDTVCEQCGNRLQNKQAYRSCLQCFQQHRAATDSDSEDTQHD